MTMIKITDTTNLTVYLQPENAVDCRIFKTTIADPAAPTEFLYNLNMLLQNGSRVNYNMPLAILQQYFTDYAG